MISLIVLSPTTLAMETTLDLTCLTRQEKEDIHLCFQEKSMCQKELATVQSIEPSSNDLVFIIGALVLGGIAGMITQAQLAHH